MSNRFRREATIVSRSPNQRDPAGTPTARPGQNPAAKRLDLFGGEHGTPHEDLFTMSI